MGYPTAADLQGLHPDYIADIFAAIELGVARWDGEALVLVEP